MAVNTETLTSEITSNTKAMGSCEQGTGHDQYTTGIIVQFDLTFSNKAWVEAERYHFLILLVPKAQCIELQNLILNLNVMNM